MAKRTSTMWGKTQTFEDGKLVMGSDNWTKRSEWKIIDEVKSNIFFDISDELDFDALQYISEWWWSNGGKRYKHIETGKEYFIKMYKNIDQSKTEFIANSLYQELWLWAPKSYIIMIQEWIWLATEKVHWNQKITNVEWVKEWFIADCRLSNRDSVKDGNILQGSNATIYRMDNGWSLFFRAWWEQKSDFANQKVNEIISLRRRFHEIILLKQKGIVSSDFKNSINTFAPKYFSSITDDDVIYQIKKLNEKMTDEKIKEIVYTWDLSNKDQVIDILIQRRDWLSGAVPLLDARKYQDIPKENKTPMIDDVLHLLELKEKIAQDSKDPSKRLHRSSLNKSIKQSIYPWILTNIMGFDKHVFESVINGWLLAWDYFFSLENPSKNVDTTPYNADFWEWKNSHDLEELKEEYFALKDKKFTWSLTTPFFPQKIWNCITFIFDTKQLPPWYIVSRKNDIKSKYLHKLRADNHVLVEWWLPSTSIVSIIRDGKVILDDIVEVLKKTWVYIPIFDVDWNQEY